jgi:hypothetical protein
MPLGARFVSRWCAWVGGIFVQVRALCAASGPALHRGIKQTSLADGAAALQAGLAALAGEQAA